MDEKLKQRVVGAIAILALGLIVVPWVLNGPEKEDMPVFDSKVPDQPNFEFETIEIPVQKPVDLDNDTDLVEVESTAQPTIAKTRTEQQSRAKPKPPAVPKPVKEATSSETKAATSTTASSSDNGKGWVVQVGSFGNAANAIALRDKLRNAGYRAFVEKIQTKKGSSYRVQVGPESPRSKADKLRDELESRQKLKGIVISHPS